MDSISALARRFGLTRSALLHYDRIGLLRPRARSPAGYRRYSPEDARRLAAICLYRNAGVPLATIAALIDTGGGTKVRAALEAHLAELDRRIAALRDQQRRVVGLIGSPTLPGEAAFVTAAALTTMLRGSGLDDDGLRRLHMEFERTAPAEHQAFLDALGLDAAESARLRARARAASEPE
jgi:DNA-binding transcriptional MerR regulator